MPTYPRLVLGKHLSHPRRNVEVSAPDIAYHTAILAQSGSGKSSFLGLLIEEILLKTQARVVIVDTNGDFRCLHEANPKAFETYHGKPDTKGARKRAKGFVEMWLSRVSVRHHTLEQPPSRLPPHFGWQHIGVEWWALHTPVQARFLGLRPDRDVFEVGLLDDVRQRCTDDEGSGKEGMRTPRQIVGSKVFRELCKTPRFRRDPKAAERLRIAMQGVEKWRIWRDDPPEWQPVVGTVPSLRAGHAEVFDLPSLSCQEERLAVVRAVLAARWLRAERDWARVASSGREDRVPCFVVLDEAHNFIGDAPDTPNGEQVAALLERIVAEGRKYGLFVILATQRPAKVKRSVLAECENVCLLRLQSPLDHQTATETWGVPKEVVARTSHFETGDGLLLGRWVPGFACFHADRRRTRETAPSLDARHWARERQPAPGLAKRLSAKE